MVGVALNVDHEVSLGDGSPAPRRIASIADEVSEFVKLLLGYGDGVNVVEAAQVNKLEGVILVINLVEDLPGHIELDTLPEHLKLVLVFGLVDVGTGHLEFCVELVLGFLHEVVENLIILFSDLFLPLLLKQSLVSLIQQRRRVVGH